MASRPIVPKRTWVNPKLQVRGSSIEGRGLFAHEPIDAGEAVIVMGGRVLSDEEFGVEVTGVAKYSAAQIEEGWHILLDSPTDADFGNHSCDANTWMRDATTTEAKRRIEAGEEITIDYAVQTASRAWSMRCNCRSAVCRAIVRGDDWRLPAVQQRNAGHFAPFLNRRIESQRSRKSSTAPRVPPVARERSRVLEQRHLPLEGIRILDLTMVWAGPVGTRLLADMGAEVIKVESARSWDMLRSLHFLGGATEHWWNKSAYFNHNNRNKYACTLDLQTARGRELALQLAAQSDIVFENYRADVLAKLRLDYEDLRSVKPDIILVSMPSHGKTGPESHHVAYGTNVEQLSGLASITGYPGMGPHKSSIAYGDPNAGTFAAAAALCALHHRQRTGEGQHVEVGQWEAMIGNIGEHILGYQMPGAGGERALPESIGNRHVARVQGVYECATKDEWVAISVGGDREFGALCEVIRRPNLHTDPRFADVVSRRHHHDELDAIIADWTSTRSQDAAARELQSAGVSAAAVLKIPALLSNAHLRARGFWESVTHAEAGTWDIEGPVWRVGSERAHVRTPAPMYGEHNRWVLRDLLGLSEAEIAQLEADGVTSREPNLGVHS